MLMPWIVLFHDAFEPEFAGLDEAMQDALLIETGLLERFGPSLGRLHVDTLKGSKHRNMKELRIRAPGPGRCLAVRLRVRPPAAGGDPGRRRQVRRRQGSLLPPLDQTSRRAV